MPNREKHRRYSITSAGRTALLYALLAGMWIFFSDRTLDTLGFSPQWQTALQTYKGFGFVLVTTLLLYVLLRKQITAVEHDGAKLTLAEERIRKERDFSDAVLDSLPGIFYLYDEDRRFLRWNKNFERVTGYTSDEVAHSHPLDFFAGPDKDLLAQHIQEVFETGVSHVEANFVAKDGSRTPYYFTGLKTRIDGVVCLLGIGIDIRERKRAEDALREREHQLRLFVEHSPAAIAMFNTNMEYVVASDRWRSDYGLGERAIIGRSHYEVFPEIPERWKEIHRRCLAGAVERCEEDPFPRQDGHTDWVRWEVRPWRHGDNEIGGIIMFTEVITERKRLEEQFFQAQKMETVGQLAGGVAHDFNNLLGVIIGYADIALDSIAQGDPTHECIEQIRRAADKSAALTRQLLAFSRKQLLRPEILNINRIIAESEKMLHRLIGEDFELIFTPDKNLGRVKADPGQIEQVLMNLVVNARDAMPAGGVLTIETRNAMLDEAFAASHHSAQPGPHVLISVSDTGTGMDAATVEKIFEPFFTTKEVGKGTGLGLATVYGIIKQSGGNIWVDSEIGKGTTFNIFLPQVAEEKIEEHQLQDRQPVSGVETVLVVEDEKAVRDLAKRILEGVGYTVLLAANATEAFHVLGQMQTPLHLMVTDVIMPGMNGRELAARVAKIHPGLKIIYMSGYTDDAIARRGALDASVHFIGKPFTASDFRQKVREVLDLSSSGRG